MPRKKQDRRNYPLRLNPEVMTAVQRWADDELRSVNAQVEYILREALRARGRLKPPPPDDEDLG